MDFTFNELQNDLRELADRILGELVTHERLKELTASDVADFDRRAWQALAEANLLGVCLPESVGGSGYGVMELCLLCEQVGRHVAPVPFVASVGLAGMTLAKHGTADQQQAWLPGVIDGSVVLTAALEEPGNCNRLRPSTTAQPSGAGWTLDGQKIVVPYGSLAEQILVPAATGVDSAALFLVDPEAPGVTIESGTSTNGEPADRVQLSGVEVGPDAVVGGTDGDDALRDLHRIALATTCATGLGVVSRGLRITADYIGTREQFGRPIGTFQAANARAADAYIDSLAIEVTTWSAVWRLAEGRPCDDELAIAKFWVADGGARIAAACQHLHGGMGADTDYAIHRHYLWAKHVELALGGATEQLLVLGQSLAS